MDFDWFGQRATYIHDRRSVKPGAGGPRSDLSSAA
jgi:hypothetical protein